MQDLYIRWMERPEPLLRESYLNRLPVGSTWWGEKTEFHRRVTFFVGGNGSGKSTLIEALAVSQGFLMLFGAAVMCRRQSDLKETVILV